MRIHHARGRTIPSHGINAQVYIHMLHSSLRRPSALSISLAVALTGSLSLAAQEARAGIMIEDYDLNLYGDFAEGKGIFRPGNTNIDVYDKTGRFRGTIAKALDVRPVSDLLYATVVDPQFAISAAHVPYTGAILFGNVGNFTYNDGTLFDGAIPPKQKPLDGDVLSKSFETILNQRNQWNPVFIKYLGVYNLQAHPDTAVTTDNKNSDFKVSRYNKLIVEVAPAKMLMDHSAVQVGDFVARLGAGGSRIAYHNDVPSKNITYGTPIGGVNVVEKKYDFDLIDKDVYGADASKPENVMHGGRYVTSLSEFTDKAILENATLGGDSGSPMFWLDRTDQEWKIVGTNSSGGYYTKHDSFGKFTNFYASGQWTQSRINFYKAPETQLEAGADVVFHAQNKYNGEGSYHVLNQTTTTDVSNPNIEADIKRVGQAVADNRYQRNWLYDKEAAYKKAVDQAKKDKKPTPVKDFGTYDPTKPYNVATNSNDYTVSDPNITKYLYHGYAWGDDYKLYREKDAVNTELGRNARSLTFIGAGADQEHTITFAADVQANDNVVHLGAASITLQSGKFTLKNNPNNTAPIKSFINAGYIIAEDASLTYLLDGQADDAIHKLGKGTLTIAGKGAQLSPLNVGEGLIELNREGGTATPYLKIASGRATVKFLADNQLVRNYDGVQGKVGLGFGRDGGVLDFNGHDLNQTWLDIYHLDKGATLANSEMAADKRVNFTFAPTGLRTFLGSFKGNFNLNYDATAITAAEQKTWRLKGNSAITGELNVGTGGTITIGDVKMERGWGQYYQDRYDPSSFVSQTTRLNSSSRLEVGRYGFFASNITLADNATLDVHNRGTYSDPADPYFIKNQYQLEKTILVGNVDLQDATSKLTLEAGKGAFIDVHSKIRGTGSILTLGSGTINLGSDNSGFTGNVKVCDSMASGDAPLDQACQTQLQLSSQAADKVQLPSTEGDFTLTPEQEKSYTDLELRYETADNELVTDAADASDSTANGNDGVSNGSDVVSNGNDVASNGDSTPNTDSATGTGTGTADAPTDTTDTAQSTPTTPQVDPSEYLKPTISEQDYQIHKNWETKHQEVVDQARNQAPTAALDQFNAYVPVPDADSLLINFYAKEALFTQASSFDTQNARVILRTQFADAPDTPVQWDMRNITGDAFLVKDDASTLQIRNHNLTGTVFLQQGNLIADHLGSHLVLNKGTMYYADARSNNQANVHGRVVNAGTIYLTRKVAVLPSEYHSDAVTDITLPNINYPAVAPSTDGSTAGTGTGTTADTTAGTGADSSASTTPNTAGDATTNATPATGSDAGAASTAGATPSAAQGATLASSWSDLGVASASRTPTLVFTYSPEDVANATPNPASNVDLPVLSSSGLTLATLRPEHQVLLAAADGSDITSDSTAASANAGSGADTASSNSATDSNTASNADASTTGEMHLTDTKRDVAELVLDQDYVGQDGKIVYDLNTDSYVVRVKGAISGTTQLVIKDISATKAAGQESFELITAEKGIADGAISLAGGYVSGGLYDYRFENFGNGILLSSVIEPEHVNVVSLGDSVTSDELPYIDPEDIPGLNITGPALETPELPYIDPADIPGLNTTGPALEFPELPVANPFEIPELHPNKFIQIQTATGPRFINSSVGTLLANRRFVSNLNVQPWDLATRDGFYLNVDRDTERLSYVGARYASLYKAQRTLVGNNFHLGDHTTVGGFINAAHARTEIDNSLNNATGTVRAYGLGVHAGTQVGMFEVAGSAQYLYAQSEVQGTHHQTENLHGGFAAVQVALDTPTIGMSDNYFTFQPYALLQAEFTPSVHFVSRLGEDLGHVRADRWTQALGMKSTLHLGKFALAVDAYKNLGTRATEFVSSYTNDQIRALNNNYRIKTTASYQVLSNVKVSSYFNVQGQQRTTGMSLDIKW